MPLLSNQPSRLLGGGLPPGPVPVPVPQLGAELLANGNFAAWTGDNPDGWTVTGESGTNPEITQRAANQTHAGSGTGACNIYGTAGNYGMYQGVLVAGKWYQATAVVGAVAVGSLKISFGLSATGFYGPALTAVGQRVFTGRAVDTNATAYRNSASVDMTLTSVSFREITLASMFSTRPYGTHATTKARVTLTAGTRAGVVANLDSAASPANFVIASHDGQLCRLTKCVTGVYTELVSQAVAYVAGAFVEIRRAAGTDTWQLWYNGAQVGANQTISDAAIKAGTLHGYFNTFAGNTLAEFSCVASA